MSTEVDQPESKCSFKAYSELGLTWVGRDKMGLVVVVEDKHTLAFERSYRDVSVDIASDYLDSERLYPITQTYTQMLRDGMPFVYLIYPHPNFEALLAILHDRLPNANILVFNNKSMTFEGIASVIRAHYLSYKKKV